MQEDAIIMRQNGIRAGQVTTTLLDKYKSFVRPRDVHRVMQTRRDNLKSLSDIGIQASETRRLLDEINKYNDQYRIKFKDNTQIMECILYWNPRDVEMAQRFCQVSTDMDANCRYFKSIRHSRTTRGNTPCWKLQLQRMR